MSERRLTRSMTLAELRAAADRYVGSVEYETPIGGEVPPDPDPLQEAGFPGRVAGWIAEGLPLAEAVHLARYTPDLHPRNRRGHWIETPDAPRPAPKVSRVTEDDRTEGSLSLRDRAYVAEGVMARAGETGRDWHFPVGKMDDGMALGSYGPQVLEASAWASKIAGSPVRVQASTYAPDFGSDGKALGSADVAMGRIIVRPDTTDLTLLHEIAHMMVYERSRERGHTEEWARLTQRLYAEHIGPEAGRIFGSLVFPDEPDLLDDIDRLMEEDRLGALKTRDVERMLLKAGFEPVRQRGSHRTFRRPEGGRNVGLPMHSRTMPRGTMVSVLKAAGIEYEVAERPDMSPAAREERMARFDAMMAAVQSGDDIVSDPEAKERLRKALAKSDAAAAARDEANLARMEAVPVEQRLAALDRMLEKVQPPPVDVAEKQRDNWDAYLEKVGKAEGPPMASVGEALIAPKTGKAKVYIERAVAALDKVLVNVPQMPAIPVRTTSGKNARGAYSRAKGPDGKTVPEQIRLSVNEGAPGMTMLHEFGHFLDNVVLSDDSRVLGSHVAAVFVEKNEKGDTHDQVVAAIQEKLPGARVRHDEDLANFYRVARETAAYKALGSASYSEVAQHQYMRKPQEVFARAFAQYMAQRSGDPDLLHDLASYREEERLIARRQAKFDAEAERERVQRQKMYDRYSTQRETERTIVKAEPRTATAKHVPDSMRYAQWDDADFAPLAEALERVLRNRGILREVV